MPDTTLPATSSHERARRFLERYQEIDDYRQLVAELFAPEVLVGDTASSRRIPSSYLAAGMEEREREFRAAGLASTTLSAWSVQPQDTDLLIVATSWRLEFVHPTRGSVPVELQSDYLLKHHGGTVACVVYRARQDVAAELSRLGLR